MIEFLKIFGVVLLFGVGTCGITGRLPQPVLVVAALGLLGIAIHHHRNRSLV
jgi:hypothetical protein